VDSSPIVPTSFVPKQPVKTVIRRPQAGASVFAVVALILMGLSLLGSAAVFGYEKYLESVRDKKSVELQTAQEQISEDTVHGFIRTRDRFSAAKQILDNHISFSRYLDILEANTLQNVRFASLSFDINADGTALLSMSGVARSFNALAAESKIFTNMKDLKRAIFSGITVSAKDNSVAFTFTANVEPELLQTDITRVVPADTTVSTTTGATTTPAINIGTPATTTPQKPATTTP